jgi:hypothetical protein
LIGELLVQSGERPSLKQLIGYAHLSQGLRRGVLPALELAVARKNTLIMDLKKIKINSAEDVGKWCKSRVVRDAFQRSPLCLSTSEVNGFMDTMNYGIMATEDPGGYIGRYMFSVYISDHTMEDLYNLLDTY